MTATVERTVFSTPRAAEFLELRSLQSQTGQPVEAFGAVVIKELLDNALDAAESAGVAPVITVTTELIDNIVVVTVTDNGAGITADTVTRICDFNNTVSDKARYRGPARGAQGNALKTLLGIPYALGVEAPVVITSQGVRHELKVMVDPVLDVVVSHEQVCDVADMVGTSVSVPLPVSVEVDISTWAFKTALVNPHATITAINRADHDGDGEPEIYKPAAGRWSKWTPSQPSSPHWYTPEAFSALVHSHIRETARTGVDVPLGRFISEFDGLSGSAKQKAIRTSLDGRHVDTGGVCATHLTDLAGRDDVIEELHREMRRHSKPTTPARLGPVGKDHLDEMLDQGFGVRRSWYKQATVTNNGVPWVIEVMVADTDQSGGIWYGCNHSPAFGDPLGRTTLTAGDIYATGAASFLSSAGVTSYEDRTAVVHVICAATEFVDKGKVALVVPREVASAAADALAAATRVIRKEDEQRRKDANKAERARRRARASAERAERADRVTLKDAVFAVIPEAKRRAGAVVSARTLYYKVRPLVQQHTDRELPFNYFSQVLLPEYERTVGTIPGLYYEPRGELHHPHDDTVTALGTREVENYRVPEWQFDKILYIEKTGLQTQLAPYQLGKKYDMAIIYGQGYAVTACRNLLASIAARDIRIFVLHDADIDGYNIARTLSEATRRMPDHNIEVVDLGLTVPQAIEYGLETETFTRKRELPSELELDPQSAEWFTGRPMSAGFGKTHYRATRCELNAFSADELAGFIEDRLRAHGADTKLIPPQSVLDGFNGNSSDVKAILAGRIEKALAGIVADTVNTLASRLAAEVAADIPGITRADIEECLDDSPLAPWTNAAHTLSTRAVIDAIEQSDLPEDFTELAIAQLKEDLGGSRRDIERSN